MGRKKIQISRITDERNRQVRAVIDSCQNVLKFIEIYLFCRSHLIRENLVS